LVRAGYTTDNTGDESEVIRVATATEQKTTVIAMEAANATNIAAMYLSHEGDCGIAFIRAKQANI